MQRRALACGICFAGVSCGKIVMPYIGETLHEICGWQWAFRVYSICFAFVRYSVQEIASIMTLFGMEYNPAKFLVFTTKHSSFSSSLICSISTVLLRPLGNKPKMEKENGDEPQSLSSKLSQAKSTLAKWARNKTFILICVSKGNTNSYGGIL